jgi:acyl-CoA thioester hydrolase
VQEVAAKHWFKKAGKNRDVLWVVRKHEIEYFHPSYKGDVLSLSTWVEKMEGLSSFRRVEIRKGESLICRCLSNWIMLDAKTMRPKRIPAEISTLFK